MFDGFYEQVLLEACSHVALLPSAMLQTAVWWFLMRTRLQVLALQSLSWSCGWPLPPPRQRRMSRCLKDGVMSRYETSRCCVNWFKSGECNPVISIQCVCTIDAPEVQIWTYCYGPTASQTHLPTICWGIGPASNNVSDYKNLTFICSFDSLLLFA